MKKALLIFINAVPILFMIGLIPVIRNDYLLTGVYIFIIIIAFAIRRERKEFLIFGIGFIFMIFAEYLFVGTGAETFDRNSLFGIMPLWLPFLWAYGYVVIKRSALILNNKTLY